jgi:TonB-dependent receptor
MSERKIAAAVRGVLLVSAGIPGAMAWAAEPQAESQAALEEVVVTGYAGSLERAIENKRVADVISDGISAEDIGKFPEQNLAESLQRITGVQITRRLGNGAFISVRGLDPKFTNTLYNGRQVPSGSGSRAFDFQVLPTNFAQRVDVYKTPTADMPESGLAATVNMQTIQPLTYGQTRGVLNVEGAYDEQASTSITPRASALYTDTFMDDRLGWMVGVDYNERDFDVQNTGTDGVIEDASYTGPGTAYRVFGLRANDNVGTDKRWSAVSALQFKVNDVLELRADTLVSRFEQRYNFYQGQNFYPGAGALGVSPTDSVTLDGNNVETAWSGRNVFAWMQANRFEYEQNLTSTALGATLSLGSWTLDGQASYGHARTESTQLYVSFATRAPGAALTYDASRDPGGPLTVSFYNGFDPNDINNYTFSGIQGSYQAPTTDKIWNFRLDAARQLDTGWLKTLKVGADHANRTLANTPNWLNNTADGFAADMSPYAMINRNPTFFDSYSGGAQPPRNWLTVNLDKFFHDYPMAAYMAAHPAAQQLTSTTEVEEKSTSLYARLDFAMADDRLTGNVGVRAVRTETLSSGFVPPSDAYLIYGLNNSLSYSAADLLGQDSTYDDVLPNFNLSYQLSDDVVLRFAAARVMQRPDMNLLAAASNPSAPTQPPPAGTWRGTLAKGNPNLKPYRADQVDLSLEWYFGDRSLLAIAGFYKDVKNLVVTRYTDEIHQILLGGNLLGSGYQIGDVIPITLSVAQPVNAQATTLKGVEIGYQQPFAFLPGVLSGLGMQANYTHIWSGKVTLNERQGPLPLTGVSDDSYNLGLYYDNGAVDVHAVYNYRSQWVGDAVSNFGDGRYVKGYGQLDLSANYNLNESLAFNASVVNLTEEAEVEVNKYGFNRLYQLTGRRYYLGMRFKF